ncbi:DUF6262 family protein [Terribacillus saccharophilus]|uniref:DUF6262 family protein n=1 Tax=Terribacillus saccharophilus TaxID=361277 RepID=UPI0039821E54
MIKINKGIEKYQHERRQNTIDIINQAIQDIKDFEGENSPVTAKKLQSYTDLSRSALYKEHTLKVWNKNLWEERYTEKSRAEKKLEVKYSKEHGVLKNLIDELNRQIINIQKKKNKLEDELEIERKRREVKEIELGELKEKNMKLLAECQRLHDLVHVHRI